MPIGDVSQVDPDGSLGGARIDKGTSDGVGDAQSGWSYDAPVLTGQRPGSDALALLTVWLDLPAGSLGFRGVCLGGCQPTEQGTDLSQLMVGSVFQRRQIFVASRKRLRTEQASWISRKRPRARRVFSLRITCSSWSRVMMP